VAGRGETGGNALAGRRWSQMRDQPGAGQAVGCELVGAPSPIEVQARLGTDDEFRGSALYGRRIARSRPLSVDSVDIGSHALQLDLSEGDGVADTDGRAGHGGHGPDELFRVEVAAEPAQVDLVRSQ
jgi:hypothetical protein